MNPEDAHALDTRRLEQFVAVADAGTLAVAAERLFITQQALSTALRQLEREVGVALFDRSGRRLVLTAAGQELLAGARPLLTGSRELARAVRRRAAGTPPAFVVGHSPALADHEVFTLLETAIRRHPDASVTLTQVFPGRFVDELLSGNLDLVLRRGVDTPADLTSVVIAYQPLRVAFSSKHPLAQRDRIAVRDLRDVPVTVWAPERHSFYTDFLIAHFRRNGVEPHLRVSRVQGAPPATAALVDDDTCVLVTDPPGTCYGGRIVVRDFDDPPFSPVQALWLPHTVSALRADILSAAP